jgi:hypothetical protein
MSFQGCFRDTKSSLNTRNNLCVHREGTKRQRTENISANNGPTWHFFRSLLSIQDGVDMWIKTKNFSRYCPFKKGRRKGEGILKPLTPHPTALDEGLRQLRLQHQYTPSTCLLLQSLLHIEPTVLKFKLALRQQLCCSYKRRNFVFADSDEKQVRHLIDRNTSKATARRNECSTLHKLNGWCLPTVYASVQVTDGINLIIYILYERDFKSLFGKILERSYRKY